MSAPSARGLFRATGKSSRRVAIRDLVSGELVKVDALPRAADDYYPTPPEPVRSLLAAEAKVLRRYPVLWEPACGCGAMARVLSEFGFAVIGSDRVCRAFSQNTGGLPFYHQSFEQFTASRLPPELADGPIAIVTNPPYDACNWRDGKGWWIRHALETIGTDYMALYLNWAWPGAAGLGPLWAEHPPARVYLTRWKVDFTGQGSPPNLNAWFVWDRAWAGEPVLRMLDRTDVRQGELIPETVP